MRYSQTFLESSLAAMVQTLSEGEFLEYNTVHVNEQTLELWCTFTNTKLTYFLFGFVKQCDDVFKANQKVQSHGKNGPLMP